MTLSAGLPGGNQPYSVNSCITNVRRCSRMCLREEWLLSESLGVFGVLGDRPPAGESTSVLSPLTSPTATKATVDDS